MKYRPRFESFAGRPLKVVSELRNVARTALLVYYTGIIHLVQKLGFVR